MYSCVYELLPKDVKYKCEDVKYRKYFAVHEFSPHWQVQMRRVTLYIRQRTQFVITMDIIFKYILTCSALWWRISNGM